MAISGHEPPRMGLDRLHNPWHKFTQRNQLKHNAEDSRLHKPTATAREVIEEFMVHQSDPLDNQIPHMRQMLRDYLDETIIPAVGSSGTIENTIQNTSSSRDFALLDDRLKHERCHRAIGLACNDCEIVSDKKEMFELYKRLAGSRIAQKAEKRIIFIPTLTPTGALVLAATTAKRTANPLRAFLHRYLVRDHMFSISATWGFFLEFHIPYHAMRNGNRIDDHREIKRKQLRKTSVLPLRHWTIGNETRGSSDKEELYYYEAQTSSLSLGADEWFWTEYFLVDTYFGSEPKLKTYFQTDLGKEFDPPLGGRGNMEEPCFDPREYWLQKVDRRMYQVTNEYSALIEAFNKRMEEYFQDVREIFEDDSKRSHTETLSSVIETTQIFIDSINATIDAWNTFTRNSLQFFTTFASDKPTWPGKLEAINGSMAELDRLRKLLLTKQERFRFKFGSIHTVSSLSQTKTAIDQGKDISTLTNMTVYIAFPLLFTTALFSMDFLDFSLPWLWFSIVLVLTFFVNMMIGPTIVRRVVTWKGVLGEMLKNVPDGARSIWVRLFS